jgi:hypothetical protein
MIGCAGRVSFANRASLCPVGFGVCNPQQWVNRRAGKAPSYVYWTNVNLGYDGSNQDCRVGAVGAPYSSCSQPMRVCNNYTDPLGNKCNWKGCGFESKTPNQFFGGCENNATAGTLCCK